jgi:hypothetical protein
MLAAALCLAAAGACTPSGGNDRDTMTARQKDSVLGASKLPGAGGVTQAQRTSDSLKARAARADAIGTDTTRSPD